MNQPQRGQTISYDEMPYGSSPIPATHPCHLSTLAVLFGMELPSLSRSRVLELGCAEGGNLIPMAQDLPQAEFVGIDLSLRQIEVGRELIQELGLANIRLAQQSITGR